jgi:ribosomal protein L34
MADQQDPHHRTMPVRREWCNRRLTRSPSTATLFRPPYPALASASPCNAAMKLKVRRSKTKRLKKVGFRTRSKTTGGRKVIKRKIKRSGKFRVG